jgi:HEAT repeat protein
MKHPLVPILAVLFGAQPAAAYIDYNPTLGDVVNASTTIRVVQVEKASKEKRVIILKTVAVLKGQGADQVKLNITKEFPGLPRDAEALLDWAEPGKMALFFHNKSQSYICLGKRWYESFAMPEQGWWQTHAFKSTGSFAYMGSIETLRRHVTAMVAGKEVVVTALRWEEGRPYAQTAEDYRNLVRSRGSSPIWRIKASTQLLGYDQVIKNKANIIGLGAGGADDVPELVKGLKDASAQVRAESAEDLGLIGPQAKAAIPNLSEATKDRDRQVRLGAVIALARIDVNQSPPGLASLIEELKDKDPAVRLGVIEALGDIGPPARPAVPALIELLKDADATIRFRSAESLGWIGEALAVPALAELYKIDRARYGQSETVADALKRIGPQAKAAIPIMIEMVKGRDRTAAEVLAAIGPEAKAAVPALIEALKDKELYFSIQAAMGLAYIATPEATEAVVPFLLKIIKEPPSNYHQYALGYLGQLGPKAKAAIPALEPLRKHPEIGYLVEEALRKIQKGK